MREPDHTLEGRHDVRARSSAARRVRGTGPVVALVALSLLGACTGASSSGNPLVRSTPTPTESVTSLTGGGELTVPSAAVPEGATLQTSTAGAPEVPDGLRGLSAPVDITFDSGEQPLEPVTLSFPYDPEAVPEGTDPAETFGISTFDEATRSWEPLSVDFDPADATMTTELQTFSWKWPWQVDWVGIGASINQVVGELVGKRAGGAKCVSGVDTPDWVNVVVANDPALAIRTCAEGDPNSADVAVVQFVNNRPYGMVVTSPVGFDWAWRDDVTDIAPMVTAAGFDGVLEDNQLYVPGRTRASFGFRDDGWTSAEVTAEPSQATLVAEVAAHALISFLGEAVAKKMVGPFAGKCVAPLLTDENPPDLLSADTVRDWLLGSSGCLQEALSAAVAEGLLDSASASRVGKTYRALGRFGYYSAAFQTEWNALDLVVDQFLVDGPNTFTLFATAGDIITEEAVAPFLGTWSGPIDQPRSKKYSNVTTLTYDGVLSGTVRYPGLGCSGRLSRFRIKGDSLLATEKITKDPRWTCVEVVRLRFTPQPGGALSYETLGFNPGNATGILNRLG